MHLIVVPNSDLTIAALALSQDGAVGYFGLRDMEIKGGWGILICGASAWIGTKWGSFLRARQATSG